MALTTPTALVVWPVLLALLRLLAVWLVLVALVAPPGQGLQPAVMVVMVQKQAQPTI